MESSPFGGADAMFVAGFILAIAVFALLATAIHVLIFCRIFAKAGYHWAYGFLMLVPVAQLIVPFYLAFADWPAEQELRELRQRTGTTTSSQW